MPTLYELDVRLRDITPPIWRTIVVDGALTLEDVHFAIQVAMGWTNCHLHQFTIGKKHRGLARRRARRDADDRQLRHPAAATEQAGT